MTRTLSEDINICYTLLFTGESELKKGCFIRALLCFEDCRKTSEELMKNNSIYMYCYYRALRKESQCLRQLGLHKRSFRILKRSLDLQDENWHSTEKLFIYLQLQDLAELYDEQNVDRYFQMLINESEALKAES